MTLYSTGGRSRRVDLGALPRGLEGTAGTDPFESLGRDYTYRERTRNVPLRDRSSGPQVAELMDTIERFLHWSDTAPPLGDIPDPVRLASALSWLSGQDRWHQPSSRREAAERSGLHAERLFEVILGMGTMLGQVRKRPPDSAVEAAGLLGEEGFEPPPAHHPLEVEQALKHLRSVVGGDGILTAAVNWCARERARHLQEVSDPDLPRLLWVAWFLHTGADTSELEACVDLHQWRPGFGGAIRLLAGETALAGEAARKLAAGRFPAGTSGVRLAIGALGLWDLPGALRLMNRHMNQVALTVDDVAKAATPPPRHPGQYNEGALSGVCRRRGWLLGDVEEPTFRERAMRPIKARTLTRDELAHFAATGDLSRAAEVMATERTLDARTRFALVQHERPIVFDALLEFSSAAYTYLGGRPYSSAAYAYLDRRSYRRLSLTEAIARRWPSFLVTEATKMAVGT